MADQIPERGPVEIIAQSFGGLIAIEIAKFRPVTQIYLISSIKSHKEKPWFFRFMRIIPFYLTNHKWLRDRSTRVWGPFFGLKTPEDVRLFYRMMPELSDYYMRWSVRNIVRWRGEAPNVPIVHIHGQHDRIFPMIKIKQCDHVIPDATHALVFTHGRELSEIINSYLRPPAPKIIEQDTAPSLSS